jgi:hypothetical protein
VKTHRGAAERCRSGESAWRAVFSKKGHVRRTSLMQGGHGGTEISHIGAGSYSASLSAALSASSVDRRATMGTHRASFGASSWGHTQWERASVETRTQTENKPTRTWAQHSDGGGRETHAHRRGAGLSFARAQTCEQMKVHGYHSRTATGDARGPIRHACPPSMHAVLAAGRCRGGER